MDAFLKLLTVFLQEAQRLYPESLEDLDEVLQVLTCIKLRREIQQHQQKARAA